MKVKTRLSRLGRPVALAIVVVGVGVLYALWLRPAVRTREALLAAIRPIRLANCTVQRFGSSNDGGYLMCANLLDHAQVAYSYGIDGRDE